MKKKRDQRIYREKTYDGGFTADEAIRFNPRFKKVEKISGNEVMFTFDNCTVNVKAEGEGDERHNFKFKVEMIE